MSGNKLFGRLRQRIIQQGPCAFCGAPYAAHRLVDTQMGRVAAGDPITEVAQESGLTVSEMVTHWAALLELLLDDANTYQDEELAKHR